MLHTTMYIPAPTEALAAAALRLRGRGIEFTKDAADAEFLLCPVPTKPETMADFTSCQTVIGGNLDFLSNNVARIDLLKDPYYLCANAAITAEAALGIVLNTLRCSVSQAKILILGWGRIGKCLTHQLDHLRAAVTVCARKESDRAMLRSLGYHAIAPESVLSRLGRYHCVINTAPAAILPVESVGRFRPGCLKLELATGVWLPGEDVVPAHGLPGKYKPEAAGALIAETVLRRLEGC